MFIFQIIAFLIFILWIAKCTKEEWVVALPVGTSLFILLLYILAFFRALFLIDYIAIGLLAITIFFILREPRDKQRTTLSFVRQEILRPETLTALGMLAVVTICVSSKVTGWWDDLNFWATDVKSLYYLNGFAGKYANVATEFGDYPPGIQLFKWWFAHFSSNQFSEGLMFAGYYAMNLIFLFPVLKWIKKKNVLTMLAGAVMLWLFPAVAEVFWCDGTCADLTMALIYGAFLVSVVDDENHNRLFYYGRQGLFLMILVLCKNTGFLWVAFGLVFSYGYHILMHVQKKASKEQKRTDRKALLTITLMPILAEGSWLIFCLLNRRVAKLTGTAVHMVTGGINIPTYQEDMVKVFIEAFISWPLHRWKTMSVDLSPLALFLLLLLFTILLFKFHILDKGKAAFIGGFLTISGLVFYTFNLICHLTIFAAETQYLEPYGMVSSIERYGAPFMIGGLYLLAFLCMRGLKTNRGFLICLLFVVLTTDFGSAWRALYSYRETTAQILEQRAEIIEEAAEQFLQTVGAGQKGQTGRVLYLRDISDVSWVTNTYISFAAAPVSVMYGNVDTQSMGKQDIITAIENAHAGFLYVDALSGGGKELFAPLTEGDFEYRCVYRVTGSAENLRLVQYTE